MAKPGRKKGKKYPHLKGLIVKGLTKDFLIKKLYEATELLGHPPTYREMKNLKYFPSCTAYENRFGSWTNAFKEANLPFNKPGFKKGESNPNFKKVHTKRCAGLRMRFQVFKRDNFMCQYCGRTPQNGTVLVVDHKNPISNKGETSLSNLITSCFECNLGKGDIILSNRAKEKGDSIDRK